MTFSTMPRSARAAILRSAIAVLACLAVSACLFTPGKFDSRLLIEKGGSFDFAYSGEILFLPLAEEQAEDRPFEPRPCLEEDGLTHRQCTSEEIDQQRREWEEMQAQEIERKQRETQQFAAIFGGIDPSSPEAGEELRRIMDRQKGWNKVEYRGNGVFHVEYAALGRLDHEFAFPVIEGVALASPFVTLIPRDDGTVRIETPGLAAPIGPLNPMVAGAFLTDTAEGRHRKGKEGPFPPVDGRFTIRTNAKVLANNTDEGAREEKGWYVMEWRVTPRLASGPSALVRLEN